MDTKAAEKNWTELKKKIKSQWSKFGDEEIESVKSDLSLLSGKIQKTYGVAKELADSQYNDFKKTLQSLTQSSKSEPKTISKTDRSNNDHA